MKTISLPQFNLTDKAWPKKFRPLLTAESLKGQVVIPERFAWSNSSLLLFKKCPRKFFWKYIARVRPKFKSTPLIIGGAFHEALAEWYRRPRANMMTLAQRIADRMLSKANGEVDFFDAEEFDKLTTMARTFTGMLMAYSTVYAGDRLSWSTPAKNCEVFFRKPYQDFDFIGVIDLLPFALTGKNAGKMFIVENKTASRITGSYVERIAIDSQIRSYVLGAKVFGIKPTHILYNVVGKCKLRKKSGESTPEFNRRIADDYMARPANYFYREEIMFNTKEVEALEWELHQVHAHYKLITQGHFGPPLDPRSWISNDGVCNEYFSTCHYMRLCTEGLDDGTVLGYKHDPRSREDVSVEELITGE